MNPLHIALGGTLERQENGWHWRDGLRESSVTDMLLSDFAPCFRCCHYESKTSIEVPHDWCAKKHWPLGRIDDEAAQGIRELLEHASARPAPIYAESLPELIVGFRPGERGWLVPIESWYAVMREQVGCWWEQIEERRILTRARKLGWSGKPRRRGHRQGIRAGCRFAPGSRRTHAVRNRRAV